MCIGSQKASVFGLRSGLFFYLKLFIPLNKSNISTVCPNKTASFKFITECQFKLFVEGNKYELLVITKNVHCFVK